MTAPPNILYFTRTDPDVQEKGSEQRTHRIRAALASIGDVYTLIPVFDPSRERVDAERRIAWVCSERRGSWRWWKRNIVQRAFPGIQPVATFPLRRPREWEGIRFGAVVSRYITLTGYYQTWRWGPAFVDLDDTPWEILSTAAGTWPAKVLARAKAAVMRRWADGVFRQVRHVWVVRPDQTEQVRACPSVSVLPNLARPPEREPDPCGPQERFFLTVGVLDHPPNYRGIDAFLDRHWPAIAAAYPGWEYRIGGKNCPPALARKWSRIPGVRLLGWVDDLDDLYRRAHAVFAPIDSGSGSCIKVLEALIQARACLGPAFALRAVPSEDCTPANGLFPCETTADYLAALDRLRDDTSRHAIQTAARRYVLAHWSEEVFREEIRTTILSAIAPPGAGA